MRLLHALARLPAHADGRTTRCRSPQGPQGPWGGWRGGSPSPLPAADAGCWHAIGRPGEREAVAAVPRIPGAAVTSRWPRQRWGLASTAHTVAQN